MATAQYDAAQGAPKQAVTLVVGGAITGAVRITVDTTKSKLDVLRALESIRQRVVEGKWPAI